MRRSLALCAAVGLLLFGACGDGDDDAAATASASASATPVATPCSLPDASKETKQSKTGADIALVTDVRQNTEGCPRMTFEFQDHLADYEVSYVDPPINQCGSGEEVDTGLWDADAYLQIKLEPSTSVDLTKEEAPQTYDGPRDISLDAPILKHMQVICDFEAQFVWIAGLDEERDFAITTFEDPARLVIDVNQT